MSSEQRQHQRVEMLDFTSILVPNQRAPMSAMLTDIGLGGAQLRTRDQLHSGQQVVMRIANEDGVALDLNVEVRYTTKIDNSNFFGAGVKFTPESHSERMALAGLIQEVFRRQSDRLAG